MDVLLINGPNLNALGTRQPEVYGRTTLADIEVGMRQQADSLGLSLDCYQSNHEGDIVDHIHRAKAEACRYIIINPGAFTHTSVAIRDALEGVEIPFVEVHISNIHAREPFRHHSYLSPIAAAVLVGCGIKGYTLALDLVAYRLAQ